MIDALDSGSIRARLVILVTVPAEFILCESPYSVDTTYGTSISVLGALVVGRIPYKPRLGQWI